MVKLPEQKAASAQEAAARILVIRAAFNFWTHYRAGHFDEIGPAQRRLLDTVDLLVEAQQRTEEKALLKELMNSERSHPLGDD